MVVAVTRAIAIALFLALLQGDPSEAAGLTCQSLNEQTLCVRGADVQLSCGTTNGRGTCVGSGGLHCAVNQRSVECRPGPGQRCEISARRIICEAHSELARETRGNAAAKRR